MGTALLRVKKETWKKLNILKNPGDTFDDVINRLLQACEAKR